MSKKMGHLRIFRPIFAEVVQKWGHLRTGEEAMGPGKGVGPKGPLQNLSGGILGVHLLDDAFQNAILREDERPAEGAEHGFAVHFLLAPGAEGLEHFRRRVGEQSKRQFILGLELRVGSRRIFAHPHNIISGSSQFGIVVPERARLGRAAGGVVLGIEIDNGLTADKVLGLNNLSVLVHHFEVGHGVSNLQHIGTYISNMLKDTNFLPLCKVRRNY